MDDHPKIQRGADGSLLLGFGEYGLQVEVAAISGDGRRMLTVCDVGTASLWDTASGEKLGELRPDSPLRGSDEAPTTDPFAVYIEAAALNRDGSLALLGLNDGTAGTFRTSDGARLATLSPPGEPPAAAWGVIRAVAFSPDDECAVVGFSRRRAGVWSAAGDRLIAFLRAPTDRLVGTPFVHDTLASSVAMSADGRRAFAGCADGTAVVWDVASGEVVLEALDHAEQTLAVFDDDHAVGWATTGGSVWLSRRGAVPVKAVSSGEHWAEVCFDAGRFLTRGFDDTIARWDVTGRREPLFAHDGEQRGGYADDARTLGFRGPWLMYPEGIHRLALRRGADVVRIDREHRLVNAVLSPSGTAVALEGWTDEVELHRVPGGEKVRAFAAPGGAGAFAFSPDGARIAIGTIGRGGGKYPRPVLVHDVSSGRELLRHVAHRWQVSDLAMSPDGGVVASLADEIVLWDVARDRPVARIEAERVGSALTFLADGRLLVLGRDRARIFRGGEEQLAWDCPRGYGARWCVSADGRRLVVAGKQSVARYDLASGAPIDVIAASIPRPASVLSWAIAEQVGARASASLWRTLHGTFLHQGDGPRGWVQPLHLSPDGLVAVPGDAGAAVLRIGDDVELLGIAPFEGRLRATRFVDGEVLLLNHDGRLFRSSIPAA